MGGAWAPSLTIKVVSGRLSQLSATREGGMFSDSRDLLFSGSRDLLFFGSRDLLFSGSRDLLFV